MIEATLDDLFTLFSVDSDTDSVCFKGVVTDTRKECSGSLFIALNGDQFDGHNYVQTAYDKGAVIALVSKPVACEIQQIIVKDTLQAYGLLANYWRQKLNPVVIAITGSNGKTTVKEMLASVLRLGSQVLATKGNFNNEIGVPQTLCGLSHSDKFAVIEMGANHAGEIERLVNIAQPNVVYVNNAAGAHLEGFGSLEGVQQAKGEMYRSVTHHSTAIFNMDDAYATKWISSSTSQKQITFSIQGKPADVTASTSKNDLSIKSVHYKFSIALKVKGQHNHSNALAAATIAMSLKISAEKIVQGLSSFEGFNGRLQFVDGVNGSTIIDDTYNANAASFKAGINVLCALEGEAWLAMGDMGELGAESQQQHDEVVSYAKESGVKALFTKGLQSRQAARLMQQQAQSFDGFNSMVSFIKPQLHADVNLLIKGSRSAQMEQLVNQLKRGAC